MRAHDVDSRPFWRGVLARLETDRLHAVLGGPGRVTLPDRTWQPPRQLEATPWGRVVVAPAETLWPQAFDSDRRPVAFLVRVDVNDVALQGYDHALPLVLAHREVYAQLAGWAPPAVAFPGVAVAFPVYRVRVPQPVPRFDAADHVRYTSAEYRVELASIPLAGVPV